MIIEGFVNELKVVLADGNEYTVQCLGQHWFRQRWFYLDANRNPFLKPGDYDARKFFASEAECEKWVLMQFGLSARRVREWRTA